MFNQYLKKSTQVIVTIGLCVSTALADEALFRAVATDDSSALSTLFLRGADPNARDAKGQVALYLALRDGQFRAAAQLLSHPDIKVDEPNGAAETPLMMAALKGQLDWVDKLLARGAKVEREGWSPLHYAAAGPSLDIVKRLLDRGAALDARSPNGTTPLMMAARYGAQDTAEWLLQRGADARARNDQNLNAAEFARAAGRDRLVERLEAASR